MLLFQIELLVTDIIIEHNNYTCTSSRHTTQSDK